MDLWKWIKDVWEKRRAMVKEEKNIYKTEYKKARIVAIKEKARRDARARMKKRSPYTMKFDVKQYNKNLDKQILGVDKK